MTFDVHDRPGADTVLLSAGLGGVAGYWSAQLEALKRRYRVVTYDQEGTGRLKSAQLAQGYSIADMTRQTIKVMDATDTGRCHFVGHALGGLVGLDLALRHAGRLASLTVVNGWATAHAHTRRCFELRLKLLEHEGPAAYVKAQPIFLYPAEWLAKNAERAAQEEAHGLNGFQGDDNLRRRIAALLAFDATPWLAAVRTPTLIVAARDDVLVPCTTSHDLAAAIPGAVLHVFPWGAHAVNVTEPDAFNDVLLRFLERSA